VKHSGGQNWKIILSCTRVEMWFHSLVCLALCAASVSGRDGLNVRAKAASEAVPNALTLLPRF
jgi:hypothetical protein